MTNIVTITNIRTNHGEQNRVRTTNSCSHPNTPPLRPWRRGPGWCSRLQASTSLWRSTSRGCSRPAAPWRCPVGGRRWLPLPYWGWRDRREPGWTGRTSSTPADLWCYGDICFLSLQCTVENKVHSEKTRLRPYLIFTTWWWYVHIVLQHFCVIKKRIKKDLKISIRIISIFLILFFFFLKLQPFKMSSTLAVNETIWLCA